MPLSVPTIRNAKPSEKRYKLHDIGGLYLLVVPTGGRLWRFDYRFEGRRKTISMGGFPEIGLADARRRRDEARKQLADGIDPSAQRQAVARSKTGADSFEVVAREWHTKRANLGTGYRHQDHATPGTGYFPLDR